jgi:acyl-CoA thioester hydrolase
VGVKRLGNTSFTLTAEFRIAGENQLVATAETIYVLMLATTLEKVPIPEAVRKALAEDAEGRIVDHAGISIGRPAEKRAG